MARSGWRRPGDVGVARMACGPSWCVVRWSQAGTGWRVATGQGAAVGMAGHGHRQGCFDEAELDLAMGMGQ